MNNRIGQSAVITGAATGIGEALVVRLQRQGWQVFAGYRSSPPQQARWFGMANVVAVPCDVTDPEQVVAAASTVEAHTGGTLDLLINNAGYAPYDGVIEAANMTEYRRTRSTSEWSCTPTSTWGNSATFAQPDAFADAVWSNCSSLCRWCRVANHGLSIRG